MRLQTAPEDLSKNNNNGTNEAYVRCFNYNYLNDKRFLNNLLPIIHGGNQEAYAHVENIASSASDVKKKGKISVIYGKNGRGKTFALDYLASLLRDKKVPTVSFGINTLANYLTPGNHRIDGNRAIVRPEYYSLACNSAKVIILDQAHDLIGRTSKGLAHRPGTQKWISNLINSADERGSYIVFSVTDGNGFGLEKMINMLNENEKEDGFGSLGYSDLGSRIDSYDFVKIENIPKEEQGRFILEMIDKSDVLTAYPLSEFNFLRSFVAAGYGTSLTPRKIAGLIEKTEGKILRGCSTEELYFDNLVRHLGKGAARNKLHHGGFCVNNGRKDIALKNFATFLGSVGYTKENVLAAFDDYNNGKVGVESKKSSRELDAMCCAVAFYNEMGHMHECGYSVSGSSRGALDDLMSSWKNSKVKKHRQMDLF